MPMAKSQFNMFLIVEWCSLVGIRLQVTLSWLMPPPPPHNIINHDNAWQNQIIYKRKITRLTRLG